MRVFCAKFPRRVPQSPPRHTVRPEAEEPLLQRTIVLRFALPGHVNKNIIAASGLYDVKCETV
jgi:hypothetical protein